MAKVETKIQEKLRQARRQQKFKRLNATQAEERELAEKFECNCCFNIAEDIVICAYCEAFFCGTCILEWQKQSRNCPKCRKYFQTAPPQRFVQNTINSLRFFCKQCKTPFYYENRTAHMNQCSKITECPAGCENFRACSADQLEEHLHYDCDSDSLQSQKLLIYMMKIIVSQNTQIEKLKNQLTKAEESLEETSFISTQFE